MFCSTITTHTHTHKYASRERKIVWVCFQHTHRHFIIILSISLSLRNYLCGYKHYQHRQPTNKQTVKVKIHNSCWRGRRARWTFFIFKCAHARRSFVARAGERVCRVSEWAHAFSMTWNECTWCLGMVYMVHIAQRNIAHAHIMQHNRTIQLKTMKNFNLK